jgi:hypothetical protein
MAQLQAARPHDAQQTTPPAFQGDPRWRNDASFTMLVAALALMVLTLVFWVG